MTLQPGRAVRRAGAARPRRPSPAGWRCPAATSMCRRIATLEAAAARILRDKARVECRYLEQLGTFGGAPRDPRGWSLTVAYFALVPEAELTPPAACCAAPGGDAAAARLRPRRHRRGRGRAAARQVRAIPPCPPSCCRRCSPWPSCTRSISRCSGRDWTRPHSGARSTDQGIVGGRRQPPHRHPPTRSAVPPAGRPGPSVRAPHLMPHSSAARLPTAGPPSTTSSGRWASSARVRRSGGHDAGRRAPRAGRARAVRLLPAAASVGAQPAHVRRQTHRMDKACGDSRPQASPRRTRRFATGAGIQRHQRAQPMDSGAG